MTMRSPVVHPRRHLAALAALLVCIGALPGCASLGSAPPDTQQSGASSDRAVAATPALAPASHSLQGQLSIKLHAFGTVPAKGLSLGFFFTGDTQAGQLDLITLMGSQLAQVNWTPDEVWLTDEQGRHRYASMAELSAAVLGEALPLQALIHWMQGAPAPQWPSTPLSQPRGFTQLGWTIDQSTLDRKQLTATRTGTATQRGVFVKVYLDR